MPLASVGALVLAAAIAVAVAVPAWGWDERGPDGVPTGARWPAADRFAPFDAGAAWARVPVLDTPSSQLGCVARETARELREQRAEGTPLAQAGLFAELGVTLDDVLATLDLVDRVATEDRGAAYKRLEDPAWVASRFEARRWVPDRAAAKSRGVALATERDEIRLTKYLVYQVDGSPVRTDVYDTALWALPDDECCAADGAPLGPPGLRLKYDRQAVYAGVYAPGGESDGRAKPLVWLTRTAANQAQLQGSVEVAGLGPSPRMFNVHENNAIPYDPAVRDGNLQRRFWYFREVVGILGVEQIPLRPHASVAGDIWNLGLGKVLALEWDGPLGPEVHLVVLADTGGAFQPNLFQLDWLAGAFPSHEAFAAWEATMPSRVAASVLVRKPGVVEVGPHAGATP